MTEYIICPECHGKGERFKPFTPKIILERCPECGGTGLVQVA